MEPTSPLAARVLRRVAKTLTGGATVLGADLGIAGVDLRGTTAGDDTELANPNSTSRMAAVERTLWGDQAEGSRRKRYELYEECRRTPEIKTAVDIISRFVFGGATLSGPDTRSFEINFSERMTPEAREKLENAAWRLRLRQHVPQQFIEGIVKGDAPGEIIHSLTDVVSLKAHMPRDFEVVWDAFDRLLGYKIVDGSKQGGKQGGRFLTPLQMVHYAPNRRWGHRYGESLLYGLPEVNRHFTAAVDVIHVLLLMAATSRTRLSFQVPPDWSPKKLDTFIKRVKLWNQDGVNFDTDGRMHRSVAKLLDYSDKVIPYQRGNEKPTMWEEKPAPFDKLLEVARFDQSRFFLGTGVPKALAGALDDAHSRAALSEQGLYFTKTLSSYQQDAAVLVLEYMARAAVIMGIELGPDDVTVRMPILHEFNETLMAETAKLRAEAAEKLGNLGVPARWILSEVLRVPAHRVDDILLAMTSAGMDVGDEGMAPTASAEAHALRAELGEHAERLREFAVVLERVEAHVGQVEIPVP